MFGFIHRFLCPHSEYTKWHVVPRTLVGPYGTTIDDVQRRECIACGYIQQAELERVKPR